MAQMSLQRILRFLAILMSLFHLYTGFFGVLESFYQRGIHLAFALLLIFLSASGGAGKKGEGSTKKAALSKLTGWLFLVWFAGYVVYFAANTEYLLEVRFPYVTALSAMETFLGAGMILAVLEASRRTLGSSLSIVAVVFIAYAYLGPFLPGILHHNGVSASKIVDNLAFTTEGIYGEALAISSTYIFLFVLFGAFLEKSGLGQVLLHFATGLAGRLRGGPAKIAVLSSAFMGSISGSAVANVTTTGTLTIPLMKRVGYTPSFAGAVEAVSSTGGQLLPPVMGSVAFLMVQYTGIPYVQIIGYALVPALLFYLSMWFVVDFEARRLGLGGLSSDDIKGWQKHVWAGVNLTIPIFVLLGLMIYGFSPMKSVVYSIASLIVVSYLRKATRINFKVFVESLEEGAKISLGVISATAVAGIIVGMVGMTGIGFRFSQFLSSMSNENIYMALVLTMIGSIILGMGLPTVPAYLVQVALTIPTLVSLGVPVHVAHLFTIYYACLSMITPPVAIAAYAASAISGANASTTGWIAGRLALPAFVIPFAFATRPALLLTGTVGEFLLALAFALMSGYALLLVFYDESRWVWAKRLFFAVIIFLLLSPDVLSSILGVILFAAERAFVMTRSRKNTISPSV